MLDHKDLLNKFYYDQETGLFYKYVLDRESLTKVRKLTGSKIANGYCGVYYNGKVYPAHRLAWFYVHGVMPKLEIDHINRVRDDNRLVNLRLATRKQNSQNREIRIKTNSGIQGVKRNVSNVIGVISYTARIIVDGQDIYLGVYSKAEHARAAYLEAKEKYHKFFTKESLKKP